MYNNEYKPINTNIGTGEAVIRDNTFVDISDAGYYLGYNSEEAKQRRAKKKTEQAMSEFEPNREGLTQAQLEIFNPMIEEYQKKVQENPEDFEAAINGARDIMAVGQMFKSMATPYNQTYNKLSSDEEYELYEGFEPFKQASSKEFAYDENGELKTPERLMYDMKQSMDGLQKTKTWDVFELLPDAKTNDRQTAYMSGNIEVKDTTKSLSDGSTEAAQGAGERAITAFANGSRDPRFKELFDMSTKSLNEEDPTLLASMTKEEQVAAIKKRAGEIMVAEQRRRNESNKQTQDVQKESSKGYSDKDLQIATKVKEIVNRFQDSKDHTALDEFMSAYGYGVQSIDKDTYLIYSVSNGKPATGELKYNDSEALYNFLDKRAKVVSRKALDAVEFKDPTPYSEDASKKQKIDSFFNGEGDNVFEGVEVVDTWNGKPSEIKVNGKVFDLSKDSDAQAAFMEIQNNSKVKDGDLDEDFLKQIGANVRKGK